MENNKVLKKKLVLKKSVRRFISQTMLTIIVFLIGMITIKQYPEYKENIRKKLYEESIGFIKFRELYNNYFGSIIPLDNLFAKEEPVFSEKITYKAKEKYKEGVKLTVTTDYMVPAINEGIVVFIGEKEGYGNTIIIEQTDGTDVFYANIKEANVNIYDYVEKGKLLGEAKDETLYLVFQKEGNIIDSKKYI